MGIQFEKTITQPGLLFMTASRYGVDSSLIRGETTKTLPPRLYNRDFTAETLPPRLYRQDFTAKTLPPRLYRTNFTAQTLPPRLYRQDFTAKTLPLKQNHKQKKEQARCQHYRF
ncbi:MAG: hypothetical protein PHQ75_06430 [Thermoguttaceae bacterium]|nr:hypothetical protein [Thermoguttaceae bacterium]